MNYCHVDVFSDKPLLGNGVSVVFLDKEIKSSILLQIAQEFKQFETVFIYPPKGDYYPIRIFTVQEELPFAGHPIVGTAAVLHDYYFASQKQQNIKIGIGNRIVSLQSNKKDKSYSVIMNQGKAEFMTVVDKKEYAALAGYFNLSESDISTTYPVEVVSTGLEYLLLPVIHNIQNAKIIKNGLKEYLSNYSAKFVYLYNPVNLECRSWDNTGAYEDIATGSAAGPLISYLVQHEYYPKDTKIHITQGKYLNRESIISGWVSSKGSNDVFIEGNVSFFAEGKIKNPAASSGVLNPPHE